MFKFGVAEDTYHNIQGLDTIFIYFQTYKKYITIVKISFTSVQLEFADRAFIFDKSNLAFGGTPAYMFFKHGKFDNRLDVIPTNLHKSHDIRYRSTLSNNQLLPAHSSTYGELRTTSVYLSYLLVYLFQCC